MKTLPTPEPARLVTASDAGGRLILSAAEPVTASPSERTISGMVVPYGPAGQTSGGLLRFARGSLTWSDPRRVKLLREHDQREVVGFATELRETDAGLYGTFSIPEGPAGDLALTEAANGLRDAFSVGVQLSDATIVTLRRANAGQAVQAAGALREVSQVSVPAFDDARIGAAAAADLVVSAWTTTATQATQANNTPEASMPCTTCGQVHAAGAPCAGTSTTTANTSTTGTPAPSTPSAETTTSTPATGEATASSGTTGTQGETHTPPAVLPAVAGAALVVAEPSTYTFDGNDSLVRDAYRARIDNDAEAADRVRRFNAELAAGNPSSVEALMTAAATRDDFDATPGVSGLTTTPRPDLLRERINAGRPIISKLNTTPISNATPFAIPKVGEFTGVGDHTEGTAHRPAGTLTMDGEVIQPRAVSGAYEISRELVDSMNPLIDRIAARQMLRDYRRQTEGKVAGLFNALPIETYDVDTALAVRAILVDSVNDDDEPMDAAWLSKELVRTLGLDVDDVRRPQLPFVGPSNAVGTFRAGDTGVAIDGTQMTRSVRLTANTGVAARVESLVWAESRVLQFRFDEVVGPGVIKLALWAYTGAGIIDTDDVVRFASTPDPLAEG
ncbi:hypothetical protein GCM10027425_09220 [Alteromonas gracilis]